jgi:hypothetical protein
MTEMNNILPYREFVRPLYSDKDTGHDFRHIERIIARLDELSDELTRVPAPHKLNFLACFHGLGSRIQNEPELRDKTVAFLRNLGWEQEDIDAIFSSLLSHLTAPRTQEEMVVHDANYFELAGPFGIAKAFTVGGARGQTYEQTAEIFEGNLDRAVFRTPAGKRLSEHRKAYAKDFLQRLRKEL